MKKNVLISSVLLLVMKFSFGQIPNSDFASWSLDSLGRLDPDSWISSNTSSPNLLIHQDTDRTGLTGYSVKFTSEYDSTLGYFEGGLLKYDHIPFTGINRPLTVQGFYKIMNSYSGNAITVAVRLYNSAGTLIGVSDVAVPLITGNVTTWTPFIDSINYSSIDPVNNYTIELYLFQIAGNTSINAHLDDLTFDGITTLANYYLSQPVKLTKESENVYFIEKSGSDDIMISLFDIKGNMVNVRNEILTEGIKFDLNILSSGIYLLKIRRGDSESTYKLVKN